MQVYEMTASEDSDHAARAPSHASCWFKCPGCIKATKHIRRDDGEDALRGTAVHKLIEACLTYGVPAARYVGSTFKVTGRTRFDKGFVVDVDISREEARCAQMAIDEVTHLRDAGALEMERKVDGRPFGLDTFGSVDLGGAFGRTLEVADYKHGRLGVPIEGNHQLFIYALLRLREWKEQGRDFDNVRMKIIQPNSIEVGPKVKVIEAPAAHVWEFEFCLREAIERTYAADAALVYGEHCRYCPGLGVCDASASALDGFAKLITSDITGLSTDQLGVLWAQWKLVGSIFKNAEKELLNRMLAGQTSEGLDLYTSVKHRKFRDEDAVRSEILQTLGPDALDVPTPAQLEKHGAAGKAIVAKHAYVPPGDPMIDVAGSKKTKYVPKSPTELFGPPVA